MSVQMGQQKPLFQYQDHKEEKAPEDEVPAGAVPEASAEPDDEKVQVHPQGFYPVSAQGNVDILPEPGA